MVENQAVFRGHNERIRQNFEELYAVAEQAGQEYLVPKDDTELHFLCECSDENCRKRVQMKPSEYRAVHSHRNRFVIIRGHEVPEIEKVVDTRGDYVIVEKFATPPEDALHLQPTPLKNV